MASMLSVLTLGYRETLKVTLDDLELLKDISMVQTSLEPACKG